MDALQLELARLQKDASLSQSIEDVDKVLEQLCNAREAIAADSNTASITLAKLQNPFKQGLDRVTDDLKKIYAAHNKYGKALDKNLSQKSLPSETLSTDYDALASHPTLINRAIAMHLLREGQFGVASTFIEEAHASPPEAKPTPGTPNPYPGDEEEFTSLKSQELQAKFANMYTILEHLRARNLLPAIEWAREHSSELEKRGSNLEFELTKLQYVWLFQGHEVNGLPNDSRNGLLGAITYARENFGRFQARFLRDIQQLSAAMAFQSNLQDSPYRLTFETDTTWSEVATSFTREADGVDDAARAASRNTPAKINDLPRDLCLPSQQRTEHGEEPADDDALRPRRRQRESAEAEQRPAVQMPLLPQRELSKGRKGDISLRGPKGNPGWAFVTGDISGPKRPHTPYIERPATETEVMEG
ncbi:hypothetical protein V495_03898 [Pseudogymnoascus sp. VKM F-4514 (FW-929)]|nr:hypothetical protein V490_02444 [Pseudogymnoascus sp. VKM F-3557]KFY43538.1 hypothetical protein V495_03898 [Pseudogymnoascus sp. VKM F-4514 (FW-929)]KFY60388.1 hypothetical protein V497_03677 [Pseudogymnoascus sp. VKM F-4516 (FW-969)]